MAEPKTRPTDADVDDFLASVDDESRRRDAQQVRDLMERITGESPVMWGESIVGFGTERIRYASGRELDWFVVGFAPRKSSLTLYVMDGFEAREDVLERLGQYKVGKSCLYITSMEQVDRDVLAELVELSWRSADHPDS